MDLLGEYSVSVAFNVFYLSLFDVGDGSRSNFFEREKMMRSKRISKDQLKVSVGPIIRSKKKKLKDAFNRFIRSIWANMNFKKATISTSDNQTLVNLIYV